MGKNGTSRKKKALDWALLSLGILFAIGLWELIAYFTGYKFLPEFGQAFFYMVGLLGQSGTWADLGWSSLRLSISLLISSAIGIFLGLIAGYYSPVAKFLSPLMTVLKAFPTIALILLLVIYVPHASLYVTGIVLLPVVYQATSEGASFAYSRFERDILLEGKGHLRNITSIILPLSADYIILGVIQAIGLGIKVEVMSETFAYRADYHGVGKSIYLAYQNVEYDRLMAYVLMILIVAIAVDIAVFHLKKAIEAKIGFKKS